jgi:hypothetical protein
MIWRCGDSPVFLHDHVGRGLGTESSDQGGGGMGVDVGIASIDRDADNRRQSVKEPIVELAFSFDLRDRSPLVQKIDHLCVGAATLPPRFPHHFSSKRIRVLRPRGDPARRHKREVSAVFWHFRSGTAFGCAG